VNFRGGSRQSIVEGVVRSDAETIAASVEQPDEFAVIFDRHIRAVYRFLARRYGSGAAADLAAETFARAFERRASYRLEMPSALPWLLGVATRVGANEHRREATQLRAYASVAAHEATHQGGEEAGTDTGAAVAALAALKRGDRDAFLLLAWGELAYDEIAAALEIPVGTVRSRINRARRQLRDALSAPAQGPLIPDGRYDHA
jgi:RNA polymerase sigma-70 factor, ECF subfamily